MAGALIKIDEVILSGAVSSVTLGASDWDNSYDVYLVKLNNVAPSSDDVDMQMRFTKTSDNSTDDSSNYDFAYKTLKTFSSFQNDSATNQSSFTITTQEIGTGTSETLNGIMYLFNFNNASEYSFFTEELTCVDDSQHLHGNQGGGVLTVEQATNGVNYFMASGNIASGTFSLYALKK